MSDRIPLPLRSLARCLHRAASFIRLMGEFARRDVKIATSYRLQFFFRLAGILSTCFTFFFVSVMMKDVEAQIGPLARYGGGYFGFALVGVAFSSYLDAALTSFGSALRTAQITGTLEAMLATRTGLPALLFGSALYPLVFTTLRAVLFIVFGVFVFRLSVHLEHLEAALAIVFLTLTSTLALGIFAAGFIILFKQGDPVTSTIAALSWFLSGVIYPKEILPEWVQRVAELLPMTHTLESMRLVLLTGRSTSALEAQLGFLAFFSVLGIPLALVWFAWAVDRARDAGSLAKY